MLLPHARQHSALQAGWPPVSCGRCLQAYQVLKRGGLDDDHIVVMMADDLAQNYLNPHPGKVYNRPDGEDVYEGVPLVCSLQ